jgi:hypothetical protein
LFDDRLALAQGGIVMDKIQREEAFNDREHGVRGRELSAQKTHHTG